MPPVNKTWAGTTGAWSTAGNWSPSGVPVATDHVRIPASSSQSITSGLDQSAVALGDFIVEDGYQGTIGSSAGYLQVDPDRFEYSGSGVAYIDIGTAAISAQIFKTAIANVGLRGLYLKGSAIATLSIMGGQVGVAAKHGETSTATTIRCYGSGASVWVGAGTTLTTFYQEAGNSIVRCALTTLTLHGGIVKTEEIGAITTVDMDAGTFYPNSTGTITTLTIDGGHADFSTSGAARTVTTLKLNPGGSLSHDPAVLTITNKSNPDDPIKLITSRL